MRQMHRADSQHHDGPTQTDRSESKPYKTRLKIALPSRKQMLALLVFQQAPLGLRLNEDVTTLVSFGTQPVTCLSGQGLIAFDGGWAVVTGASRIDGRTVRGICLHAQVGQEM